MSGADDAPGRELWLSFGRHVKPIKRIRYGVQVNQSYRVTTEETLQESKRTVWFWVDLKDWSHILQDLRLPQMKTLSEQVKAR